MLLVINSYRAEALLMLFTAQLLNFTSLSVSHTSTENQRQRGHGIRLQFCKWNHLRWEKWGKHFDLSNHEVQPLVFPRSSTGYALQNDLRKYMEIGCDNTFLIWGFCAVLFLSYFVVLRIRLSHILDIILKTHQSKEKAYFSSQFQLAGSHSEAAWWKDPERKQAVHIVVAKQQREKQEARRSVHPPSHTSGDPAPLPALTSSQHTQLWIHPLCSDHLPNSWGFGENISGLP